MIANAVLIANKIVPELIGMTFGVFLFGERAGIIRAELNQKSNGNRVFIGTALEDMNIGNFPTGPGFLFTAYYAKCDTRESDKKFHVLLF